MAKTWKTTGRVREKGGGFVAVPLEFDIDWQGLADQLGHKAYYNRSGRSRFLNGLIVVRVAKPKKAKA